ncbi:MAG: GNAT family N-acetyltransferase [Pseudomonadaceae bacterium]|nr:GNAT family N-acetyltransferase [Pseudomonadaceae bacterium]
MIQSATLTSEKKRWIANLFEEFNESRGYKQKHEDFCFEWVEKGELAGIVHGKFFGGWCAITDLAVADKFRGQNIGKRLIQHVEKIAKTKLCEGIHLTTISFQAPEFYAKLGYECYATLDNYAGKGNQRLLYKKVLE